MKSTRWLKSASLLHALACAFLALCVAGLSECGTTDADGDGWSAEDDCDDEDAYTYPGADELCDDADNDCDEQVDEGIYSTWYLDQDSDGYGDDATSTYECEQPEGYAELSGDCDDEDPLTYPHATEICDSADNDCDGEVEDSTLIWYMDRDGDGFGNPDETAQSCPTDPGYLRVRGDCDDGDTTIYPGATDTEGDGIDQDCGGKDGQQPSVGLDSSTYTSLQEALGAATDGDTVWVGPGEYSPDSYINFHNMSISLSSTCMADQTTIFEAVAITGGQGNDVELDGFTITGNTGCGLSIKDSSPTIANMTIRENGTGYYDHYGTVTDSYGGGMCIRNSTSLITDTEITDNYVYAVGTESIGSALGGGIYAEESSLTLERCRILRNRAYAWQYSSSHTPEAGSGGGIYLEYGTSGAAPTVIRDSIIADNETYGSSGGIRAETIVYIENSVISGNRTIGRDSWAAGVNCASCSVSNSVISNNQASGKGGGILFYGGITIQSSVISGNTASIGGGLFGYGIACDISNSVVASNHAVESGGGLYVDSIEQDGPGLIINSIISHNEGGNVHAEDGALPVSLFRYTDIYNPSSYGEDYNLPELEATNLEVEPAFLAYDEDGLPYDFHLSLSSPLIDVGDPSLSDPDGTRSDMGAFGGPEADLMDLDQDGYPNYFWPGTIDDAPAGFDPDDYDVDDLDWDVH